jgi:hypothetical protein
VEAHIKENAAYFHRFNALWTPTLLVLDGEGVERMRSEGYLPMDEFRAWLELALARFAFVQKRWTDAEGQYEKVIELYPGTSAAPEAMYWRGVSRYKETNDHTALGGAGEALKEKYPDNLWAVKASVWLH